MVKILIVYYSMYGHVYKMAQAVAEGVKRVSGVTVKVCRVAETLPDEILQKMGALEFKEMMLKVPICTMEELATSDAIIFGTPTRFGNMCTQMKTFLDATGKLWQDGSLIGKLGSVFTSTATQHGGQESTILSFHITLLHHGMIVAGLPYSFQGQMQLDEISGGSPYGASTIAGTKGERMPSKIELEAAKFQGEHIAKISTKLSTS
jgi:NAD(P)H dehydrogenase (quinone)